MKKLASIIIPVYNVNQYIEQCIDSVVNLENVEVVVIDDGSQENTDFLPEKYKNYENFKFYRKENGGLSSARNYGINKATAEYIIFLDGDDYMDTVALEQALQIVGRGGAKTAYFYQYKSFIDGENIFHPEKMPEYFIANGISIKDKEIMHNGFAWAAWRYIVKRDFIIHNNLFFKEGLLYEDSEWTPRLITSTDRIYPIDLHPYLYRQRAEGNITSAYTLAKMENFIISANSLSEYKKHLDKRYARAFIDKIIYGIYGNTTRIILTLEGNKADKRKYLKILKSLLPYLFLPKLLIVKFLPIPLFEILIAKKYKIKQ